MSQSKCNNILSKLDIFSYIPVPHTYPISSKKSKIGSLIFLLIIIGYFIYDFVIFITDNNPVINLYYQNPPVNQIYSMPNIAFGFVYGSNLNNTLNNVSYLTYLFQTVTTNFSNQMLNTNKTTLRLINNCKPQWLGVYNNIYRNLTCVDGQLSIMNAPLKNLNSIVQRLTISLCVPGKSQVPCQNSTTIAQMMAGGRLIMIINQPQGFNFKKGEIQWSDSPFKIYQFFLVPGLYNRVNVLFYPFNYITYPTFLTSFSENSYFYFNTFQPVSLISNVSVYNTYLTTSITLSISSQLTQVQVHYQTIIQHISLWGALASLIFTIMALCCLGYNKNKFLKKNPSWKQFDKAFKKKIEQEVQIKIAQNQDEENSGIAAIRKQVQLTHDL